MRPNRYSYLPAFGFVLLSLGQGALAQASTSSPDTLNRLDEMGRKQGWWQINAPLENKPDYANGQLIEEGKYTNSKRSGVCGAATGPTAR